MKLTETQGVYASHPLGGCRMAESPDLGVVDHRCEVFGYEGLYCIDSSTIPTSLGVNPSLTIAAVAERCAEKLVERAGGLGRRPAAGLRAGHAVGHRGRAGRAPSPGARGGGPRGAGGVARARR